MTFPRKASPALAAAATEPAGQHPGGKPQPRDGEPPIGQAPGDAYLFGPPPGPEETAAAGALEATARELANTPPPAAADIIRVLPLRDVREIHDMLATTDWGPHAGTSYAACAQRLSGPGALLELTRARAREHGADGSEPFILVVMDEWQVLARDPGTSDPARETALKTIRDLVRAGRETGIRLPWNDPRFFRQYGTPGELTAAHAAPREQVRAGALARLPWECPRCHCLFERAGQDHEPCRDKTPETGP